MSKKLPYFEFAKLNVFLLFSKQGLCGNKDSLVRGYPLIPYTHH